jgi:hypothetical protein
MVTTAGAGVRLRLKRNLHDTKTKSQAKLKLQTHRCSRSIRHLRRQFRRQREVFNACPVTSADLTTTGTVDQPIVDVAVVEPALQVDLDVDMPISVTSAQLAASLRGPLTSFLKSNAGGKLSANATVTLINRISQFMEWMHRHLSHGQNPPDVMVMATSARPLFHWYIDVIGKHPHMLEEYVNYQLNVIQRGPSTILNHLDALVQCFNFLVYDGRLDDQLEPVIVTEVFQTRFPFYNQRCRRTLKKLLKKYK